jgi:hypothetical protein
LSLVGPVVREAHTVYPQGERGLLNGPPPVLTLSDETRSKMYCVIVRGAIA